MSAGERLGSALQEGIVNPPKECVCVGRGSSGSSSGGCIPLVMSFLAPSSSDGAFHSPALFRRLFSKRVQSTASVTLTNADQYQKDSGLRTRTEVHSIGPLQEMVAD